MLSFLALAFLPCALAAPQPHGEPIHIPIVRRANIPVANLPQIMDSIRLKYGFRPVNQKRSTTSASLTDEVRLFRILLAPHSHLAAKRFQLFRRRWHRNTVRPFFTSLTPPANSLTALRNSTSFSIPASFRFALSSIVPHPSPGSSDLWVATTQCTTCTSGVPLFDSSKSSSYKNGSTPLQISYGSGDVGGYASQDTVTFSDFTISGQELRASLSPHSSSRYSPPSPVSVSVTSTSLLSDGLSGIMGLGFDTLSTLQATPFWQSLLNENMLSSPVFSFYLERYIDQSVMNTAPGGMFTLGGTNTSLYSGNIEFIDMPSGSTPSYWLQQVQSEPFHPSYSSNHLPLL